MKTMQVPHVLWGEAVSDVVYILNRINSKALKETTPYELWTGGKPNMGHLRVFGCVAYMKTIKIHLKKLEDRSKRVVHLGIEKGTKACMLLDLDSGSIYVSRDVKFKEKQTWLWEEAVKVKSTPGMSFMVEGYDLYEIEDIQVGLVPSTLKKSIMGCQKTMRLG